MKALLNNRFAPVTFSWGFLEKPIAELTEFRVSWGKSLRHNEACVTFEANLADALPRLEPLYALSVLYISTKSTWTAVFQGSTGVTSPLAQVSYAAETIGCRGLIVTCIEDTFNARTGKGLYGGTSIELFAPARTSYMNVERVVSAINDAGKWVFDTFGAPKEFEKTEAYSSRKIRERFTPLMLEEYCAALGITLFDADFYGPNCALIYSADAAPADSCGGTYAELAATYQNLPGQKR